MSAFRAKPRVHPKPAPTRRAAAAWSPADKACLQRAIDPLHKGFRIQPFGFLRSEGSTLLCAPPSEVYERLTSILTNVGIVSGLVLSAIAGAALNPLNLADFPEKRLAAEAYNVVAAVTVAAQLCVVLYCTFTLYIVISAAHNPTAVYRALVHMMRWSAPQRLDPSTPAHPSRPPSEADR